MSGIYEYGRTAARTKLGMSGLKMPAGAANLLALLRGAAADSLLDAGADAASGALTRGSKMNRAVSALVPGALGGGVAAYVSPEETRARNALLGASLGAGGGLGGNLLMRSLTRDISEQYAREAIQNALRASDIGGSAIQKAMREGMPIEAAIASAAPQVAGQAAQIVPNLASAKLISDVAGTGGAALGGLLGTGGAALASRPKRQAETDLAPAYYPTYTT